MEKQFNEQESLRLITETISQVKNDLQKGGGDMMILWGYGIAFIALLNFALIQTLGGENGLIYAVWTLCIPLYIVGRLIGRKKNTELPVKSRAGNIISSVWNAHIISILVVIASFFAVAFGLNTGVFFVLINSMIIIITGLALFVTGKICAFKPFVYGSIVLWCGALASSLATSLAHSHKFDFIILALCMILGFIIPGHTMNNKRRQDV